MKFYPLSVIQYYIRYLCIFLFICLPLFMVTDAAFSRYPYSIDDLFLVIFLFLLAVYMFLTFYFFFLEKCFSYLIIEDSVVTWKCPFRKSISIPLADCKVIGLEYEDAFEKEVYAYIYFVTFPYSQESSKYYGKVKCKEGLIKYRYTNKLAKYVIANYSDKISYSLHKYYRDHKKDKVFY